MASVKRTIRVGVFFVCLLLFFWQAYEIVKEYLEKEIATKVCGKKVFQTISSLFFSSYT